jgi:hypothetical protein
MTFFDRVKQRFWDMVYPFFRTLQRTSLKLHLVKQGHNRQKFLVGWLAPGKTLEGLKIHLHDSWGFGNHFVAWTDDDQVLSWRKLTDFQDQYHLRVYSDGEIRGHYEFTPEAHPIEHFKEIGEVEKKEDFLKFLGEFVTEKKHISHLLMDPDAYDPKSEITIKNSPVTN